MLSDLLKAPGSRESQGLFPGEPVMQGTLMSSCKAASKLSLASGMSGPSMNNYEAKEFYPKNTMRSSFQGDIPTTPLIERGRGECVYMYVHARSQSCVCSGRKKKQ